jgi:hypothetical protein
LQGVDPGRRAGKLADAFEADLGDSTYCFNDWHAAMALGLAGRIDAAEELRANIAGRATGTNRFMLERAGLDVIGGVIAFVRGDFGLASEILGSARPHARALGGSHAQRDAIDLTLLAAAAGANQDALVRALLAERVARKPTAAAAARRIIEVGAARGEP